MDTSDLGRRAIGDMTSGISNKWPYAVRTSSLRSIYITDGDDLTRAEATP